MNRRRYAAIAGRDVLEYTQEPRAAVAAFSAVMEDEAYADQDSLMDAAEKRAKRYHISAKQGGNRTPPKGFPAAEAEYGDPVNYKYPADAAHARPALGYFNQDGQREKGGYSSAEWAIIGRRLARLISRHLKAKYAYKGGKLSQVKEDAEKFGGPGSGNWGHAGRPGQVGGSVSNKSAMSISSGETAGSRQQEAKVMGAVSSEWKRAEQIADDAGVPLKKTMTTLAVAQMKGEVEYKRDGVEISYRISTGARTEIPTSSKSRPDAGEVFRKGVTARWKYPMSTRNEDGMSAVLRGKDGKIYAYKRDYTFEAILTEIDDNGTIPAVQTAWGSL